MLKTLIHRLFCTHLPK